AEDFNPFAAQLDQVLGQVIKSLDSVGDKAVYAHGGVAVQGGDGDAVFQQTLKVALELFHVAEDEQSLDLSVLQLGKDSFCLLLVIPDFHQQGKVAQFTGNGEGGGHAFIGNLQAKAG